MGDIDDLAETIDEETAAVILEPIQGEAASSFRRQVILKQ